MTPVQLVIQDLQKAGWPVLRAEAEKWLSNERTRIEQAYYAGREDLDCKRNDMAEAYEDAAEYYVQNYGGAK
jgi:hypothetical protein